MKSQQIKKPVYEAGEQRTAVSRQAAILLSVAMLVIGFIAGTVFGVLQTFPDLDRKSGSAPEVIGEMPPRMSPTPDDGAIKNPQNADEWTRLGNAYFDGNQYGKAIEAYEKSLSIEPDNPNVLTDLGVMYRRNKQPQKAVEMFGKAMAVDPKHEISRMNKGIVLLHDLEDEQGAIAAWEELLEINPLATLKDGQTVDELVRHYNEGHENREEGR